MLHSFLLVILSASTSFTQTNVKGEIDAAWLDRVNNELNETIQRYYSLSRLISEESETRIVAGESPNKLKYKTKLIRRTSAQLNANSLTETTTILDDEDERPIVRVDCSNEAYRFSLTSNHAGGPYVLTKYFPVEPGDPLEWAPGGYITVFEALPHVLNAVQEREGHILKSIKWDHVKQLLFVSLSVRRGSSSKPFVAIYEMWIDPDQSWQVRELKIQTPSGTSHRSTTNLPPIDGLSFPSETSESIKATVDSESSYTSHSTFRVWKTSKTPSDFHFAAFGLPERLDSPLPKRKPMHVWLLAGAAVLAIVGLAIRRFARYNREQP